MRHIADMRLDWDGFSRHARQFSGCRLSSVCVGFCLLTGCGCVPLISIRIVVLAIDVLDSRRAVV